MTDQQPTKLPEWFTKWHGMHKEHADEQQAAPEAEAFTFAPALDAAMQKQLSDFVSSNNTDGVEILIKSGAKADAAMLYTAAIRYPDNLKLAQELIAGGAVPDMKTLGFTAYNGHGPMTGVLVSAGGVEPTSDMLHKAVTRHPDTSLVAEALIAGGAMPEQKTLDFVAGHGCQQLKDLLLMPEIGTMMKDGTIYAGESPTTHQPMYAAPTDAPLTRTFDEAAYYAKSLEVGDRIDFRVPDRAELDVLYENRDKGALKKTFNNNKCSKPSAWYWSSTPDGPPAYMWMRRFKDGGQGNDYTNNVHSVRCIR